MLSYAVTLRPRQAVQVLGTSSFWPSVVTMRSLSSSSVPCAALCAAVARMMQCQAGTKRQRWCGHWQCCVGAARVRQAWQQEEQV